MNRSLHKPLVVVAALAALSGCTSDAGYRLPDYRSSGGGGSPSYPSGPGYAGYGGGPFYSYGHPGSYDPRYFGYGGYDPFYYSQGMMGPYPYGYVYGPYPRYIVVPCVDNNHDGRCDRHPGKHDPVPPQDGNGQGSPVPGNGAHDGSHPGHHQDRNGSVAPPPLPYVMPRVQAPVVHAQPNPAVGTTPKPPDPRPERHQGKRDENGQRASQP
jgi:hypothetical protein